MPQANDLDPIRTLDALDLSGDPESAFTDEELETREIADVQAKIDFILGRPGVREGLVLSLYGIGGQGKSIFLNKLREETIARHEGDSLIVSLDLKDQSIDCLSFLKTVSDSLFDRGVPCRSFLSAYYLRTLRSKGGSIETLQQMLGEDAERLEKIYPHDGSDERGQKLWRAILDAAVPVSDMFTVIPFASVGYAGWNFVASKIRERRMRQQEDPHLASARELVGSGGAGDFTQDALSDESLVERLKEDIGAWVSEEPGRRIVFFVDTFERLYEHTRTGGYASRDRWFRSLSLAPATLWVIAGRRRVAWPNVIQYPIQFVEMSEDEARGFLMGHGIVGEDQDQVIRKSGRLPVYLDICCRLMEQGKSLDTVRERQDLPDLYLLYLDPDMRTCVHVGSVLISWTEEEFGEAIKDFGISIACLDELERISFIYRTESDHYQMHELVAKILRRSWSHSAAVKRKLKENLEARIERLKGSALLPGKKSYLIYSTYRQIHHLVTQYEDLFGDEVEPLLEAYAKSALADNNVDAHLAIREEIEGVARDRHGEASQEYFEARIMTASAHTQIYLRRDRRSEQDMAIRMEDELYEEALRLRPEDEKLLLDIQNSRGVSRFRDGRYREAIACLEPIWERLRRKRPALCGPVDAARMNNYGVTMLKFATSGDCDERRGALELARLALERSLAVRQRLLRRDPGNSSHLEQVQTVRVNLGICLEELGDAEAGQEVMEEALADYMDAGYGVDDLPVVYCLSHLADLDLHMGEAALREGDRTEAVERLERARDGHRDVLETRRKRLGPDHRDTVNSLRSLERCEGLLASMASDADGLKPSVR